MLHLKLVDGSDIYINALAVRFITSSGVVGQCDLFFNASDRITLAGDAKHVAETVHKGLRIIHHSQE